MFYSELIPKDHFLRKLDEYIDWSRLDAPIHLLYCEGNGRPVTNTPRRMFKAEILQYLYDWSDRDFFLKGFLSLLFTLLHLHYEQSLL